MIEQWWVWTVTSDDGLTFKVRPHPPPKQVRDMDRRVVEVVSFPAKEAAIHEAHVLTIEEGIRHGLIAVIGYINKAAARMAMEIMETVRAHGVQPIHAYYGVTQVFEPIPPIECFYVFIVYGDGTHTLHMHAAAPLRTIDPLHKSEGGIL